MAEADSLFDEPITPEITPEGGGDIIPSVSIGRMLAARDGAMQLFREGIEKLAAAQTLAHDGHMSTPRLTMEGGRYNSSDLFTGEEQYRKQLDVSAWQYLMNQSGMRTFMDQERRSQWDEKISKQDVPEFTLENARATFSAMYADRQIYFDDGVVNVFKKLSWSYKTNSPIKFGKKIILTYFFSTYQGKASSHPFMNHQCTNKLDDLIRVFSVLDGKPEPDHRTSSYQFFSPQIDACRGQYPMNLTHPYFFLRAFGNGNAHLTFRRPDLVKQMNAILATRFPNALADDSH